MTRGPFALTLRRCLATTAAPTAFAAVAGWLLHLLTAPRLADETAPAAAAPWLALPLMVAAAGACLTAIGFWPTFAREQRGQDWVRRLQRGPADGRLAAAWGALAAQTLLALPAAVALAPALGAPAQARARAILVPDGEAVLAPDAPVLVLRLQRPLVAAEAWLRPRAALPAAPLRSTSVALLAGDDQLGPAARFMASEQLVRLEFPPAAVGDRLVLRLLDGNLPLFWPPGSAELRGPADRPTWANALLGGLVAVLPSLVALGIAALLGPFTRLPILATATGSILFLQWVGGLGPTADALLAVLRGHWLSIGEVLRASLAAAALGSGAMLVSAAPWVRARR